MAALREHDGRPFRALKREALEREEISSLKMQNLPRRRSIDRGLFHRDRWLEINDALGAIEVPFPGRIEFLQRALEIEAIVRSHRVAAILHGGHDALLR